MQYLAVRLHDLAALFPLLLVQKAVHVSATFIGEYILVILDLLY
jgi:hypothetical protein